MGTAASTESAKQAASPGDSALPDVPVVPSASSVIKQRGEPVGLNAPFQAYVDQERRSEGGSAAFADLAVFEKMLKDREALSLVNKEQAARDMFTKGKTEMQSHFATLRLQLERLNFLPDDWADSQADEVVIRVEAMLLQEKMVVSRMEAMLSAAREAVACKREKSDKLRRASKEHRAAELEHAEMKSATPPNLSRRDSRMSWRGGDGTPRYLHDAVNDATSLSSDPSNRYEADYNTTSTTPMPLRPTYGF